MGFPQIGLESVFKDAGFNAAMKEYKTSVNDAKDLTDMTGKSMGESFSSAIGAVGKFGAAVAGLTFAAGVAAFTALGAAAWKAGMDVDNAVDGIIIATGAMGPELDELTESYKRVLSATSSTAAEAGVAVGEISRRWQLTGDDLAELSVQFLDLARLMKVDVKTTITDVALAMEAFNVPAEDAVKVMEQVFVASQKSGVEMGTLLTTVKQYAAPMKALGFNFKTSVAMIAKWTSKGLDANKMVMALRLGIANMVDPTKDADAALEGMGEVSGEMSEKFADAVEAIKNATTETEALNIGMSIFGKRGAVDLVTAIREGKLTAEEFTAAMDDSSGAIERTFQATKDWPELMQQVKNQVTVALEPIGTKFLDIAKIVLEKFMPVFQDVVVPFINDKVVPIFDALGKAMLLLIDGNFAGAIDALLPDSVIQRWKDFSPILGGLADIVKTALKGLTGANIWEDTLPTFDPMSMKWNTGSAGLKTQMIALGGEMLKWIGQGIINGANWLTTPEAISGITTVAKDIAFGLTDALVSSLKAPENTSKTGQGIADSLDISVKSVGTKIGMAGWTIAGAILKGLFQGMAAGIVNYNTSQLLALKLGLTPPTKEEWDKVTQTPTTLHASVAPGQAGIFWGEVWANIQDFFKAEWNAMIANANITVSNIENTFEMLWLDIKGWFTQAVTDVDIWIVELGAAISLQSALVISAIKQPFIDAWLALELLFSQTALEVSAWISNLGSVISSVASAVYDSITKPFVDAWNWIKANIPGMGGTPITVPEFPGPQPLPTTPEKSKTGFGKKKAALGFEGIVFSPTMFTVGESGPERVSVMPMRGSEPGRSTSPAGSMGGGGGDNYWVLNITTSAPTENILNDYRLLASMGGSA